MSMPQLAPRTGFKFMLTVREGPDLGASFQLLPPRVTIGRGADNNIVLNDPRMSRNAAAIEFSMEKIAIIDLSGRNTLAVNGESLVQTGLKDGDIIRIGDTEFTFFVEAMVVAPPHPNLTLHHGGAGGAHAGMPHSHSHAAPPHPNLPNQGLSGRAKFYIGLAVAGVAFVALLNSGSNAKKKEQGLRTVEEIEKEIKESQDRQGEIEKKRVFKTPEEKTRYDEANRHFLEGFRDYQKGQWQRAMRSFETARTIDPKHPLAGRYFKLAEKQRDEMIALLTLEGRRYLEKNMFSRCAAQFEKVLDLIQNTEDVKYKSALALKKECDLQSEGKFRY